MVGLGNPSTWKVADEGVATECHPYNVAQNLNLICELQLSAEVHRQSTARYRYTSST